MTEEFDPFADANPRMVKPRIASKPEVAREMPTTQELGFRFRSLRSSLQLSQEAVAERVGSTVQEIAEFEERGNGSVLLLLNLVREFSSSSNFNTAFKAPRLKTKADVVAYKKSVKS